MICILLQSLSSSIHVYSIYPMLQTQFILIENIYVVDKENKRNNEIAMLQEEMEGEKKRRTQILDWYVIIPLLIIFLKNCFCFLGLYSCSVFLFCCLFCFLILFSILFFLFVVLHAFVFVSNCVEG